MRGYYVTITRRDDWGDVISQDRICVEAETEDGARQKVQIEGEAGRRLHEDEKITHVQRAHP